MWLAGTSIKKHFIFKVWIVKTFFKSRLQFYYECVEIFQKNEILKNAIKIVAKLLGEAPAEKKEEKTGENE